MRSVRSSTTQHKEAGQWGEQILKQKNIINIFFSLQIRKIKGKHYHVNKIIRCLGFLGTSNYSNVPSNTDL